MTQKIFIGGANRGGRAFSAAAIKALPASTIQEVIIADPKDERAIELAEDWQRFGVKAVGYKRPCEDAVDAVADEPDAVAVLSIDTLKPMGTMLKKNLPTQWQLMGRGLGSNAPVIGLSGSINKHDTDSRAASVRLIDELSSFVVPQSSSVIRNNLLNADALQAMRRTVSEHSVRRLQMLDREPTDIVGGPLNLHWGGKAYPLAICEKKDGQMWKENVQQALELAKPGRGEHAIALVGSKNVDFFVIEESRGRRRVRFHLPIIHALPATTGNNNGSVAAGMIAGLAVGFGLLGTVAPYMAAAAVVTD